MREPVRATRPEAGCAAASRAGWGGPAGSAARALIAGLALVAGLAVPGLASAQAPEAAGTPAPASYDAALERLAAGDTVGALARLREATREAPRFGPAYLRLGALLSARAGEREREFEGRREAERLLAQAVRLMGNDPEALLEYGLLLRRQQIRVDAKRVLDRAWRAAERRGESLPPLRRAQLQFELGKIYEAWWSDWQNLVMIPPTAAGTVYCAGLDGPAPHPTASVVCPKAWAEQAEHVVPLADLRSEERDRMLLHYRLALEADPAHVDAAVRLLGHLADGGEWAEYERVARQLVAAAPDDPRSHLFLGLGLHETRRDVAADSAFQAALERLPDAERGVFEDIAPLLPKRLQERYAAMDGAARAETAELFFTSTDPLHLTEVEERRLEHYARLAWAELMYSEPASGYRGWESERGQIWVRYGPPWKWYQCCYGTLESRDTTYAKEALRYIYWSYGPEGPVFVFRKPLAYPRALLVDAAKQAADELSALAPELYRPRVITSIHDVPNQVARFRGSEAQLTRVEIHAQPPLDSLGAAPGSRLEAGVFLYDQNFQPLWTRRHEVAVGDRPVALTYVVELPTGEFRFGVESRRAAPDSVARPASRARASLSVPGFPDGRLSISDLLLADALRPQTPGASRRSELFMVASRTLRFAPGDPIHVYFEAYGLRPDQDGLAGYRAELAVEDSTRQNLVQRLARGANELFRRGGGDSRVSWERVAPVHDDIAIDYLSVELPALSPGDYVMRLRITEPATGQSAEVTRRFRIEAPSPPDEGAP